MLRFIVDSLLAFIVFAAVSFFSLFPYLIPWSPAEDSILEIGFPKKFYWVQYRCNGEILGGWQETNLLFDFIIILLIVVLVCNLKRRLFK